jgi:hypothetical protein
MIEISRMGSIDTGLGILLVALVGLGMICVGSTVDSASSTVRPRAPVIDDISCDIMEHLDMHIHAHLDIFIHGRIQTVPSDIGIIDNECIYWMHTHDDTGIIHIESPEKRNFTLGEFFDIWNQNFSSSQIFENIVDGSGNSTLNVYVNGSKISASSDYRQIPINAHDEIAIVFGKPPDSVPTAYKFEEGL